MQLWKHNHFEAYKKNTHDTATRNLPPGINGEAATLQMLKAITLDKQQVTTLCNQNCVTLWLDAANVCNLTYVCPYKPNTFLPCRTPSDIGLAWKQCSDPANCKRMAFIFDYYGTEVYRRGLSTTHQDVTTNHIMTTIGIVMDVPPAAMRGGQKTCIEQQYSYCAKTLKTTSYVPDGKNIMSALILNRAIQDLIKIGKGLRRSFLNDCSTPPFQGTLLWKR